MCCAPVFDVIGNYAVQSFWKHVLHKFVHILYVAILSYFTLIPLMDITL
jgi:glycopeptide antibiotics resistance protein